jgi:hypothetical protein
MRKGLAIAVVVSGVLAGCAPAQVAGTYTGAVTNRENGCNLDNWMIGASTSGITMVVTQSNAMVSADVQGLAGVALALFSGNTNPLSGNATAAGFSVSKNGTRGATRGMCAYTGVIEANGTLNGNALDGTITYRYSTNNASDCAELSTCRTVQGFAFVRPPR